MHGSSARTALVTGGAGFVGSAVVRHLLDATDAIVVVVDSLCNGRKTFLPDSPRVHLAQLDIRDTLGLRDCFSVHQPDVVIHLAAHHFIPFCNQHPVETFDVNVSGTESLLQACREHPPLRIAVASTAAVYPIYDEPNTEEFPTANPTDVYGLSKWVNERQLALYSQQVSTLCGVARLSNVYGPRETNRHVLPEIVEQVISGAEKIMLGNVEPKRDYIYTEDVASGIVAVALKNESRFREYNISTGTEHSVKELVEKVSRASGRSIQIVTDPDRVRKSDRPHLLLDNTRAERELDWKPRVELTDGIGRLWGWSVSNLPPAG